MAGRGFHPFPALATLALLAMTAAPAGALPINVDYGNLNAQQIQVVDAVVADWLGKDLPKEGKAQINFRYDPILAALPAGAEARYPYGQGWAGNNPPAVPPLAVTDNFAEGPDCKPASARIVINSTYAWWNGVALPPGGVWPDPASYDLRSVLKHEVGHAIGFAIVYTKMRLNVAPGPGADRTFQPTGTRLTPANAGTHTVHAVHLDDVMNPEILPCTRILKNVNPVAETVLAVIWRLIKTPGASATGLVALSLLLLGTAFVILRRRSAALAWSHRRGALDEPAPLPRRGGGRFVSRTKPGSGSRPLTLRAHGATVRSPSRDTIPPDDDRFPRTDAEVTPGRREAPA